MIRFFGIRYVLALLLATQFIIATVSCTSSEEGDDSVAEESEPIDDADLGTDASEDDDESLDASLDEEEGGDEGGDEISEEDSGEESSDVASNEDEESEFEEELEGEEETEQPVAKAQPEDELEPAEEGPEAEEPATTATPEPAPAPQPVASKIKVRDIRYLANSSGGSVVIETSEPVSYQTRMNPATQQFVIEMANVELPPNLQRPFLTKGSASRIGSINAYQGEGSDTARIVIQLSGRMSGEPIVQQEGASLVVIPPSAPIVAQAPEPSAPAAPQAPKQALAARTLDEFLTGNQRFFGRPISLQVKEADVRDVVNFLAEESGANIVMSDDVDGKISLKLRKVPWDQALVMIMRTKGLGYVRQGNVLRISTLKNLQAESEAASKIIESQRAIEPDVAEVIPVSYANLDDLVKSLKEFLSKPSPGAAAGAPTNSANATIVADNRTSTLIVNGKAETVDRVKKLVKTLDIPPGQVSIEAKIVEAVEAFEHFVGVNWSFLGSPINLSPAGGANGAPIDLTMNLSSATLSRDFLQGSPFNANLTVGTLDIFGDIAAALTLAERNSLAKVISAPRISAMNREKSTIKQEGQNISIKTTRGVTSAGEQVAKEAITKDFSLELSVTPQITADSGVIMDLDVKREFLGPIEDAETKSRAINKRSAKTKILVKNGQTAVIGGIYTSDELQAENGVPGLKNLPLIGWFFKNKSFERTKNELLIFLTPRIIAQDSNGAGTSAIE